MVLIDILLAYVQFLFLHWTPMAEITVHFLHSVFSFVLYAGDAVVFLRLRLYVLCDHVRLQHYYFLFKKDHDEIST